MTEPLRIEKLQRTHATEEFTCGQPELDRFLARHALQAQQAHSSQTYVGVSGAKIVGFYSIVVGEVQHADAPERVVKGMPRHPIPILVLARLAVHSEWQGRRLGAGLLHDALARTLQVADIVGVRALVVHAKDCLLYTSSRVSGSGHVVYCNKLRINGKLFVLPAVMRFAAR